MTERKPGDRDGDAVAAVAEAAARKARAERLRAVSNGGAGEAPPAAGNLRDSVERRMREIAEAEARKKPGA
jgi:hypothetical protein